MTSLHRELVSNHDTVAFTSKYGRVALRKTQGRFYVTVEDFETQHISRMDFATERGAMIALDNLKAGWL